jgi:S-adenosylmethionine hydrolase
VNTYGQVPPQQLVALVGSSDRIEIALTCGNASIALGVTVGAPVQIAWEQP